MNEDIRQEPVENINLIDQKRHKDIMLTMNYNNRKLSTYIEPPLERSLNKLNSVVENKIVWVRIEFENIGEVDTMNEKYQAQVRIKSKWYHIDNAEDVSNYDPKKHWYPKLYIENALHDVKEEISYKVNKLENGRTMITETRVARGSFWER
jgi:hypothetical protein